MNESHITINGKSLSVAQSMTVRVALNDFAMSLRSDGLGDDDHGKAMVEGYLKAINEIFTIMKEKEGVGC